MPKLFLLLSLSPTSTSFPEHVHSALFHLPPPFPNPCFESPFVCGVGQVPSSVGRRVSVGRPTWGGLLNAPEEKGVRSPSSSCGEDSPLVRAMLPRSTALWRGEGDKFRDRNSVQRWFPTKRFAIMSNRQKGAPKCDRLFWAVRVLSPDIICEIGEWGGGRFGVYSEWLVGQWSGPPFPLP